MFVRCEPENGLANSSFSTGILFALTNDGNVS